MRKIILVLIIILFNEYTAQTDSIKEALSYYPLQIGNYWQYQIEKRGVFPSDSGSWIGHREVVGKTIMPNKLTYYVVNESGMNDRIGKYIRVDTNTANIYQYDITNNEEVLVDSLLMKVGNMIDFQCLGLEDIFTKNVFGIESSTRLYSMWCSTIGYWYKYELAKNFGMIYDLTTIATVYAVDYEYKLIYAKIDGKEYGTLLTNIEVNDNLLSPFSLHQNYPNPFNPTTSISYSVPHNEYVTLKIYDVLGKEITALVDEVKQPGEYEIQFNAQDLPSGIYFYQLQANDFRKTKKMILLK